MVLMSKLRPGGEMLRTTSIQRAKRAQVRMGSSRDAAGGDEEVRAEAGADDRAEGDDAEDGEEDDAGGEFASSAFAAEAVAEDAPAEFGESGELGAALGGGPGVGRVLGWVGCCV